MLNKSKTYTIGKIKDEMIKKKEKNSDLPV